MRAGCKKASELASKYLPLSVHLKGIEDDRWVASLEDIERILAFKLPKSARDYQAFWSYEANPRQPQKLAIRDAGWRVRRVDLPREILEFERDHNPTPHATRRKAPTRHKTAATVPKITKESEVTIGVTYSWGQLGQISLDRNDRLAFPAAPSAPGLYRFELNQEGNTSVYIGEAAELPRRFQHYRTPGPTQPTNRRLNEAIRKTLRDGGTITVSVITEGSVNLPDGVVRSINLSKKSERVFLEHAALTATQSQGRHTLNR